MDQTLVEQLQLIQTRLDGIEAELRNLRGDDLFAKGRLASRARVIAAGLSDADIDAMIKEAREDVAHIQA